MSGIHLERAARLPATDHPAAAMAAINHAFIDLLADPLAAGQDSVFGLDATLVAQIAALPPPGRQRIAAAPVLLAEFALGDPNVATAPPLDQVAEDPVPLVWRARVSAFANRLLTSLWHSARRESGLPVFCMGLNQASAAALAALSFTELCSQAERYCAALQARHAEHPSCWNDLVRFAHTDQQEQFAAACLGMIPLTVAAMNATAAEWAAR